MCLSATKKRLKKYNLFTRRDVCTICISYLFSEIESFINLTVINVNYHWKWSIRLSLRSQLTLNYYSRSWRLRRRGRFLSTDRETFLLNCRSQLFGYQLSGHCASRAAERIQFWRNCRKLLPQTWFFGFLTIDLFTYNTHIYYIYIILYIRMDIIGGEGQGEIDNDNNTQ